MMNESARLFMFRAVSLLFDTGLFLFNTDPFFLYTVINLFCEAQWSY